jgi:putative ABC transport system permease protein
MKLSPEDFRYAFRRLHRSPAFSIIAVLTLALGIGAATAMFTVIHSVLLKPLPYANPQQLVTVREHIATQRMGMPDLAVNANHLLFWQDHNHTFSELAALRPSTMTLGGEGDEPAEEIGTAQQTANLPSLLGTERSLGRTFLPEEERPGHQVVIFTDGLWRRHFAADPAIVGKTIPLSGGPYLVVGILPPSFSLPDSRAIGGLSGTSKPIEAFVPFGWGAGQLNELEGDHNYFVIGRLKPGVTVDV